MHNSTERSPQKPPVAMNVSIDIPFEDKDDSRRREQASRGQGRFALTPDLPGFMRPQDPNLKPKLNLKSLRINPSIDVCDDNESVSTIEADDVITFFDASTIATDFEVEDLGDIIHTPFVLSDAGKDAGRKGNSTFIRQRRRKRSSKKEAPIPDSDDRERCTDVKQLNTILNEHLVKNFRSIRSLLNQREASRLKEGGQ